MRSFSILILQGRENEKPLSPVLYSGQVRSRIPESSDTLSCPTERVHRRPPAASNTPQGRAPSVHPRPGTGHCTPCRTLPSCSASPALPCPLRAFAPRCHAGAASSGLMSCKAPLPSSRCTGNSNHRLTGGNFGNSRSVPSMRHAVRACTSFLVSAMRSSR